MCFYCRTVLHFHAEFEEGDRLAMAHVWINFNCRYLNNKYGSAQVQLWYHLQEVTDLGHVQAIEAVNVALG